MNERFSDFIPFTFQFFFQIPIANTTGQIIRRIGKNFDFELHKIAGIDISGTGWEFLLRDDHKILLEEFTISGSNWNGTGARPLILPAPYLFRRGSRIILDAQKDVGAKGTTNDYRIVLHGVKFYV